MRIGMVMSLPFPPREGIGFYIWNLSRYLTQQGHTVHIITRGVVGRTQYEFVDGIHIWRPTFFPLYPMHAHVHGLFVDRLIQQIEGEIDLFHLHTPLVRRIKTKRPVLVTVHTPMKADTGSIPVTNLLGMLIRLQAPVSFRLEDGIFEQAEMLTAVAGSVAQELKAYAIDPRTVHILGNGVDTEMFFPAKTSLSPTPPYFLTVGRLAPRKGLYDLVRAAAIVTKSHPDYHFLIAGEGPLRGEIEHEIERHGLQCKVTLIGHLTNREKLIRLYQGATAYVHAAHYEGLPTALLEGMACGRPVVSTAVSGALDVIKHGENGLLVPPHAPEKLAEAVKEVITQPQLASIYGKNAHKTIAARYSWHVISRHFLSCYAALVKETVAI
jgi:glycosyltransferase involved in cell wall biosynthesis